MGSMGSGIGGLGAKWGPHGEACGVSIQSVLIVADWCCMVLFVGVSVWFCSFRD